jgi:MFS family permease
MNWLSRTTRRILPQRPWLPADDLLRDRRLPAPVDLDPHQLARRAGDDARAAAHRGGAAAATPTQMGLLTAMEIVPFVLFSLPAGVWLDRVRKLPVYIAGECAIGLSVASVPLAWWAGWLTIHWLYVVGLVIGTVYTVAGSAAQIVLTQVVPRERLVEAHAKNALAGSGAEVVGPGSPGALIKVVGAPLALLVDAVLVAFSAAILRGVPIREPLARPSGEARRWRSSGPTCAPASASSPGTACSSRSRSSSAPGRRATTPRWWCRSCSRPARSACRSRRSASATRRWAPARSWPASSATGSAAARPGPSLVLGIAICGAGWLLLSVAPANAWGVAAFTATLMLFSTGAVLIFINFLALRQSVTPAPLLGRMTSTMRWLILIPAGPGALLGGWLGEHSGLRTSLAVAGGGALLLAVAAIRLGVIRNLKSLPEPERESEWLGAEADVRPQPAAT